MNATEKYLEAIARINAGPREGYRYRSIEGLVMAEGEKFTVTPHTFKGKRLTPKNCFGNATGMALTNPGLIYCEGFASGAVIPVHHAWVVDRWGQVYDPTWKSGSDYIGIPFDTDFLRKTILRRKWYGLIDDWQGKWPLLKTKHPANYRSAYFPIYENRR